MGMGFMIFEIELGREVDYCEIDERKVEGGSMW
jgi:hypothetical protein